MAYNYEHFRTTHLVEDVAGAWRLKGPQPGTLAPDFALPDTDGEPWRLANHRGDLVLLHFGSYT